MGQRSVRHSFASKYTSRGTWVAQEVKPPTLDFSSGYDLTVHEFEPHVGLCTDGAEPAWDSLFPSLSLCPSRLLAPPPK